MYCAIKISIDACDYVHLDRTIALFLYFSMVLTSLSIISAQKIKKVERNILLLYYSFIRQGSVV